jgi:nucleoside-diphosphate-sugar epimerase
VNVYVTGGSGFLGASVIPLLVDGGHEVTAMVRSNTAAASVAALGAIPVLGDLDDPASVDSAFAARDGDTLVNLASMGFGHAPVVVAAAEEAGLRRAVFVSTTAIFTALGTPSKPVRVAAEEAVMASALAWTILRPTMIYGHPGDRNISRLLRLIRRSPVVPIPGGGGRLQQPVHVDDVAAAVIAAVETEAAVDRVYNVAGPAAITLRQLVEQAGQAVGRRPMLMSVPLPPIVLVARLYERASREPRLRAEQLERLTEDKVFDISAAEDDLGYEPRPFADGIRQEAGLLR